MEFIRSNRGGDILCLDGYQYRINYVRNGKRYWKCKNCKCSAVTEEGMLIKNNGEHTHTPENTKIEIKKAVSVAKEAAMAHPFQGMKRVYREAFADVDVTNEAVMDDLPSFAKYRCTMYRSRASRLPKLPHQRAEVNIVGQWSQTKDGRQFLLANDGVEDKLLIFAT